MYNAKLIFLSVLIFSACSVAQEELHKSISLLDAHMLSTGTYVIIPNQGCEGCISQAEAFVKKNIRAGNNTRYIFTRIQSTKLLKIKLGTEIMNSSKILLDTANTIVYPDKKKEIYPMTVTLADNKIIKLTYQSPE
jgi:hypothetical protein